MNSALSDVRFSYDDYTRYLSNLNYMYLRVDRRAEVVASVRDLGKGDRGHSLSIYVGGVGQALDLRQQKVLRDMAENCMTENQDAWIVLDTTLDVVFENKVIPKRWLSSILPHVIRDSEYLQDGFLYWRVDVCEPLCMNCKVAQERVVSDRYYNLLAELLALYERGSIVGCTERFARDWELERDDRGVWHPTWTNSLLTSGDATLYLILIMADGLGGTYASASADSYRKLEFMDGV